MTIGHAQLVALATGAGFPGDQADTAAAIALAESGGNATAHNHIPPDDSYGLWQINMIGNLGPMRRKALHIPDNSALFDPAINASAAVMIWKAAGNKFGPWTTYTNGDYKTFLSGAVTDEQRQKSLDALNKYNTGIAAANAANPWLAPLVTFADNMRKQGWNALVVVVALVLVVLGVVIIMRRSTGGAVKAAVKLL